ncbi:MAG: site-specific integrase, partial [Clostridia bacterium]|nr:site-specific integrase [Clostridia bacterium]
MPAYKDKKTGKWYASFYCMNWKGVREKKMKRGFETKKAALEWEREFLRQSKADLDMRFDTFVELYVTDLKQRLRENTFLTKESIIYKKVLPYFKEKKLNAITAKDVIKWQNELLAYRDETGKPYSKTYLKTIHNQLSAIFNHAIRYYDLKSNPAAKAGHIGEKEAGEMDFWTKEEYKLFANEMMDKPKSFYAFEVLYWCGIRLGELLALTPADFDFENGLLRINKSYQRIGTRDVITEPKTKKSIRTIKLPTFLCEEIKEYLGMLYGIKPT